MATTIYSAKQLEGAGSDSVSFPVGTLCVFSCSPPLSPGAAYFTLESTKFHTTRDQFYYTDLIRGGADVNNFSNTNLDTSTFVQSPYILSFVVPPGGGAYRFFPNWNIPSGRSKIRGTGGFTCTVTH